MPELCYRGTRERSRYFAKVLLEKSPAPHQDEFYRVLIFQRDLGRIEEYTISAYSSDEMFHSEAIEPLLMNEQDRLVYLAQLGDEPLPDPNAPQSIEEEVSELLRDLDCIDAVFDSGKMDGED